MRGMSKIVTVSSVLKTDISKIEGRKRMEIISREEARQKGLVRYYTGKPCKHGHICERFTKSMHCLECGKVRSKKYVQQNPERRKQTLTNYAIQNYDSDKLRRRKFVEDRLAENPNYWKDKWQKQKTKLLQDPERYERRKQKAREYANSPEVRERSRRLRRLKRKLDNAYRNKLNIKTQTRRRRVRKSTPNWLDKNLLIPFYKEAQRLQKETGIKYAVDHYYPLKSEIVCGLNVPWNLQVITWKENSAKHNRMPEEFYGANHQMKETN
jgi:hypothetical protein